MEVSFADESLAAIETDPAGTSLPLAVVNSARKKLHYIRAAPDERSLRNWRSLHYEKLSGKRSGQRSIRLNEQWRMILELDESTNPHKIIVLSIENHYEKG